MAKYLVEIENGALGSETINADDMGEAKDEAVEWVQEGDWDGKSYIDVRITRLDDDGDETDETETVEVAVGEDEPEPECVEGEDHDWQSPQWLGGCRENPGVWSRGGTQIASVTVCAHCGVYRHYVSESTPGQMPHEPEQTTYEEADERSEEWVREQRE